jgi:hypothetical protein
MIRTNVLFSILILIFSHCSNLNAHIINVPDDFEAIQGAIDESEDGDTVLVQPGEYVEHINFEGKAITVASLFLTTDDETYIDSTIIDGDRDSTSVVVFRNEENENSRLSGFTICNSFTDYGGGVYINNAGPVIDYLIITDNEAYRNGGGIYCTGGATAVLSDLTIHNNRASRGGGGISTYNESEVHIERCIISENDDGGGLRCIGSIVFLKDVSIINNIGSGIYCSNETVLNFEKGIISGNSTDNGGGVLASGCELYLNHMIITGNTASSEGDAIKLYSSILNLTNVSISGHYRGRRSPILTLTGGSELSLLNCIIWEYAQDSVLIGDDNNVYGSVINVSYSNLQGGQGCIMESENLELNWGDGNIDEDPLFADPACQDYYLTDDSPCINAGDPDSPEDADSTRCDIGALPFIHGGYIEGFVYDLENGEPIEGVTIFNDFRLNTQTDEEGFFRSWLHTLEPFNLTVSLEDYVDFNLPNQQVDPDDTLRVIIRLRHSEFQLSTDRVNVNLNESDSTAIGITVINNGNGILKWQSEKRLSGETGVKPWELRRSYNTSEETGDTKLNGVVFIEDNFYVSGSNRDDLNRGGPNMVYILDRNGNEINRFEQFGESVNGMKDLCYDGELIWGIARDFIIGFTTDGDSVTSIEAPVRSKELITWDNNKELFWIAYRAGSYIHSVDRAGDKIDELPQYDLNLGGLSYWQDDPDGYNLYLFHNPGSAYSQAVHKMNTDTGDTMFVGYLQPEGGGIPNGSSITNQYDPRSSVFINISDDGGNDRIDVWQLVEGNTSWMIIEPERGEVQAESLQEIRLSINSEGLSVNDPLWEAELIFSHNAAGGEIILPVTLTIRPDAVENDKSILIPDEFDITSIYPNPFNSAVTISYNLHVSSEISLQFFDITGREVANVFSEWQTAGSHTVVIDNTGLSAGLYLCRLKSESDVAVRKIVLVK